MVSYYLKTELLFLCVLRHRWELKKISRENQMDTSKWPVILLDAAGHSLQFVKEVGINHGNLINDQVLTMLPLPNSAGS